MASGKNSFSACLLSVHVGECVSVIVCVFLCVWSCWSVNQRQPVTHVCGSGCEWLVTDGRLVHSQRRHASSQQGAWKGSSFYISFLYLLLGMTMTDWVILNDGCVCLPVCVCSGSSGHGFRGPPAYLCLHDVFYQWQNLDPYQTLLVNSTTCYNSTVLSCNKQPLSWQHCSVILGLKVILCHLCVCVCVCTHTHNQTNTSKHLHLWYIYYFSSNAHTRTLSFVLPLTQCVYIQSLSDKETNKTSTGLL